MKKKLFFVLCCFAAVSAFAQQSLFQTHTHVRDNAMGLNFRPAESMAMKGDYNYRMTGYSAEGNYLICRFYYNEQRQLEAVYEEVPGDFKLYDSVRYNEAGQLVRLDGYQWLANQWKHVYYVEYGYNDNGQIATRTNYNHLSGEFQLGGVYEYTYNSDGQLILTELTMMGDVCQRVEYVYADGLLQVETWSYPDYSSPSGAFEPAERIRYNYEDGRLVRELDSLYANGMWTYYGKCEYVYDQVGNCTEFHRYDMANDETERSVYTFDERTVSETLIPWNPELGRPHVYNNVNIYTSEEFWTLDVDMVLQYVGDYIYTYAGINDAGIADVEQLPLDVFPNPAINEITISGIGEGLHQMDIVDMSGRVVMSGNVTETSPIDLSGLQGGCYLVRVLTDNGLHSAKVIVK